MKNKNTLNLSKDPNSLLGGSNDISYTPVSKNKNKTNKAVIVTGFNSSPIVRNTYRNINYINRSIYNI